MEIEHFSHKHLLVLNEGIENKDDDDNSGYAMHVLCYACWRPIIKEGGCSESDPCEFFLHKTCAELPKEIIKYPMHPEHSLTLFTYERNSSICNICRSTSRGFTYNCSVCGYELHHWSHEDHPLILQSKDKNEMKVSEEMLICDGCVKSINAEEGEDPYYACLECNFFLHKICATLPREFHDNPFEYEPLQLLKPRYDFDFVWCRKCRIATNGFYSAGSIGLDDVICAALPKSIKHEAHEHPLLQNDKMVLTHATFKMMKLTSTRHRCASCSLWIEDMEYRCEGWDFHIHSRCIVLPRTMRHRWDPHPIPLVYPPIPDHPDLFYCEICEEEIDTKYWLYFCGDCDQAFHIDCLHPIDKYSNVKLCELEIML